VKFKGTFALPGSFEPAAAGLAAAPGFPALTVLAICSSLADEATPLLLGGGAGRAGRSARTLSRIWTTTVRDPG